MSSSPRFGFVVEYVKDIEVSKQFYVDVMGLQIQRSHSTYVQFDSFAIASDTSMDGESKQELFWIIDNAQIAFDHLSTCSDICLNLKQLPFGKVFGIRDKDGYPRYLLELAKNRPSQQVL